jgi:EpsD family peptidyl-prolyl cis-trans isomerase
MLITVRSPRIPACRWFLPAAPWCGLPTWFLDRLFDMMRNFILAPAFLLVAATAGCDKGGGGSGTAEWAARVNGAEISVVQLKSAISPTAEPSQEQMSRGAPQALETIIERQLLAQDAVKNKLEGDPKTALLLENARKQVLAQAAIEKAMSVAARTTQGEIQAFYDKNPALFAQRRVYRFQEIGAAVPGNEIEAVKQLAQKSKSILEIGAWLKARNIPFNNVDSTKPAEQLPMELLPQLSKMSDGQIAIIPSQNGATILQLAQSQQAPLDLKQATPLIEQFIQNGRRLELAKAEVKRLREAAKIEYAVQFTPAKADGSGGKGQSAPK